MRRGELWWAALPEPVASGPGYRRPVLIVQSDLFNLSRINTVVAVSLNVRLAAAPGNILVNAEQSGLSEACDYVSQLPTVNKSLLTEFIGTLPRRMMAELGDGVRLALGL